MITMWVNGNTSKWSIVSQFKVGVYSVKVGKRISITLKKYGDKHYSTTNIWSPQDLSGLLIDEHKVQNRVNYNLKLQRIKYSSWAKKRFS